MSINRDLVYPVFIECIPHAKEIFWENIFEDLAYGKSPYGTYISKGFLCCSYKKKDFSYKIENKDSLILYQDIYNLFSKKLNIMSSREKNIKIQKCIEIENNKKKSRESWSKIRKKNVKEILIELYVSKMKSMHSLSIKQSRFLLSIILMSIIFKKIIATDINYLDGSIQDINGITFSKQKIILDKKLYEFVLINSDNNSINLPLKEKLSDSWEKYIKDLDKYNV